MDIKELAKKTVAEAGDIAGRYRRLHGYSLDSVRGAFAITKDVVKHVEEIGLREALVGAEKQALAIEIIIVIIKPGYFVERLLRFILPYAVDMAVSALKDKFGK